MSQETNPNAGQSVAGDIVRLLRGYKLVVNVDDAALKEAAIDEILRSPQVLLDECNLTPGMKDCCTRPIAQQYEDWQVLDARFRDAVASYGGVIAKIEGISEKIEKAATNIANAENIMLSRWRYAQRYKDAKSDYEHAEKVYIELQGQRDEREPKIVSWFSTTIVLLMIGAVEWLINYDAFLAVYGVVAVAVGFTIIVALAVALASHFYGVMFRQWDHYFGTGVEPEARRWNIGLFVFITVCLLAAMIFVGATRYLWAKDIMQTMSNGNGSILTDGGTFQINAFQKVAASLLGNLIVWMFGTGIVWGMHDQDPEFANALRRRNKYRSKYTKYKSKIDEQTRSFVARQEKDIQSLKSARLTEERRDVAIAHVSRLLLEVRTINRKIEDTLSAAIFSLASKYRFALFEQDKSGAVSYFYNGEPVLIAEYLKMPLLIRLPDLFT